ncbi:hypothetical protein [Thioalkalivibrio sp. XN8]|uniref:GNAT family N-acetyltransferase n=1 Tax=Thioalkalivibrio sp. XN8 TaxID=2712863 RepID=UPI0013EE3F04|nr:hypothetical protein [Thioalkalivibrio sp. XN8]NGP53691.1 hypothetical protein [Thioalkalivibrio sp. XN8]
MIIRPLEGKDIPEVAALYQRIIRRGTGPAPAGLESEFRKLFIEAPVCAADLPSLVLEAGGEVAGFQGVQVREFEFDGVRRRLASVGPVFVVPELRTKAAGAQLIKAAVQAGQELTLSDGAGAGVSKLWELLGGKVAVPQSIEWTISLRPARAATKSLARRRRRAFRFLARALHPLAVVVDRLADGRWNKALHRPPVPLPEATPLSAGRFAELAATVDTGVRLRMVYSPELVDWIFRQLTAYSYFGEAVACEVKDSRGVIGWFIGQARPDGVFQVLDLQAVPRSLPRVFAALMAEAARRDVHAVSGRIDGRVADVLASYRSRISFGHRVLVHSGNKEILDAVLTLDNNISRIEGEWLMGIRFEPFEEAPGNN